MASHTPPWKETIGNAITQPWSHPPAHKNVEIIMGAFYAKFIRTLGCPALVPSHPNNSLYMYFWGIDLCKLCRGWIPSVSVLMTMNMNIIISLLAVSFPNSLRGMRTSFSGNSGRGKIVPRNVNLTARKKGLQRFWLHHRDRYRTVTQTYNNCAETHPGGGVMSPFVSPLSAIARAHDPTVIDSVALRKGPRRFCPCTDAYVPSAEILFCLRFGRASTGLALDQLIEQRVITWHVR